MKPHQDAEFTDYMSARMPSLRRLALLLCQDWHGADDLLQVAMTKTFVHWSKAAGAENTDGYVRAILVREFVHGELRAELEALSRERFRPPEADSTRCYAVSTLERWYYACKKSGPAWHAPGPRCTSRTLAAPKVPRASLERVSFLLLCRPLNERGDG